MTYRYFNNETTRSSVLKAVADTSNEKAWKRLFDLYAGFVFSIARSKGLTVTDSDDIVQNVFVDLARNLPQFNYDRTKGRFRSYLIGLVNWRVTDKLRASKRDVDFKSQYGEDMKGAVAEDDGSFLENEWRAAAMEEALRRIKDEVKPDHFAAFVASTIEGQDTETVMNLYSITRDNLYQIRKRLTLKLKEATQAVLAEMDNPSTP
ncbi:MAG: sigma-70 family RNA polymerase sigma factor [Kiritimatiellae bacterium]|nr:sigma-70 family RNA polymerase sigma factor [Kiritimatiellia bacterium]